MRFPILALLIALPVAAHAAMCAEQLSLGNNMDCADKGAICQPTVPCCEGFRCDILVEGFGVCSQRICHTLADPRDVRYACNSATLSVLV
ncbi:hypothetical protein V8E53_010692 [Lactarius tabidus]